MGSKLGKGFVRLKEQTTFKLFNTSTQSEMRTDFMLAFEDEPGKGLWFGGSNALYFLNRKTGIVSTESVVEQTFGDRSIWSLERDLSGLWVVSNRRGLFYVPLSSQGKVIGEIKNFTPENSFIASYLLHQVFIDSRGWMWLGYEGNGLQLVREPKSILNEGPVNVEQLLPAQAQENTIGGNKIRRIYEDQNGDIWLATMQNGFSKIDIDGGVLGDISVLRHDPDNENSLSFNDGRSIYHQNDSTYWFATYGGGINRWNANTGEFLRLGTEQGLPNNSTYGILPDADKSFIWVSTNSGLARLNTETLNFNTFTPEEGIQNLEFNTGAYHQLSNGHLAFGGIEGFNIIDTEKLKINETPPPIYLTDIKIFNESHDSDTNTVFKKSLMLNYNQNFLSFEFAALDFENPSANQYAYKMEGIDSEWVYPGTRNFADYPNLESGSYTFRVKASNSDGVWNEAGISLPIKITPPWWESAWFRISAGSVLFAGFILGIRHILQRRLREQLRQMEMENKLRKERERISRDLHDHVGAQLANIKTGLSLADKYSQADNKEKSSSLMHSIRNDAEITIKQLRETIWALNQDRITTSDFMEHLKLYFRDQTSFNEMLNIEYYHDIDDEVELSAIQALNIFRIIQEASQNTLKYAEASHLKISMIKKNGMLKTMIEDDGVFKDKSGSAIGGYGLGNMKKRAKEIDGELSISTEDGTKISLHVET
ncbi:triple tyrosine motif-containing protein [Gracilimonas sp.]|uniref:sensor histidine kinase n=1 Tax=Gracilimonas sp. TaxID=1974203 RepID=UPI002871C41F|nr:triple tyrosine motif-containing protein [Gracilimonas sp.]